MHPILFQIGNLTIYSYGVFTVLSIVVSYIIFYYLTKKEKLQGFVIDLLFISLIFTGLIGARIAYVIEHWDIFFSVWWWKVFFFWEKGLSLYGGVILSILFTMVYTKVFKLPLWKIFDIIGISGIFAVGIGRLGCLSLGCCYGKPTSLPIGIVFPSTPYTVAPHNIPLWPTQLMEFLGNILIGIILLFIWKSSKKAGLVFAFTLIFYGFERFWLEFVRDVTPIIQPIGLTWNQIVSILMIILGAFILLKFKK
jgi:phosphatidylglycerol:prolipoprotein diacylglycerol transferase